MEEPFGVVNGSNPTFTLNKAPYGYTLELYKNGILILQSGVHSTTMDYTLSGNTIAFISPPASGATIMAQSYGYL
jgi:hypothetical protein